MKAGTVKAFDMSSRDDASTIELEDTDLVSKIPPKHAREADIVLGILFNG